MHICLLTSTRVFEVQYGGEERFTSALATWLSDHNCNVTLVGSTLLRVKAERITKDSADVGRSSVNSTSKSRLVYPPYIIYALSRLLMCVMWIIRILVIHAGNRISVIHAQDTGYAGLAALIAGKILHIPVILTCHSIRHLTLKSIIESKIKNLILKMEYHLDLFTIRHADSLTVVSSAMQTYFEGLGSRKIVLIPIPIIGKHFIFSNIDRLSVRHELGLGKDTLVMGYVGRFAIEKNLFILLEAFATIVREDPSVKLIMIGKGPLENELKLLTRKLNVEDNVIFCGVRYDIGRLLSAMDIFLLLSHTEGLPTALIEAMTSGRAIICSNIPAHRELIQNAISGILVDQNNRQEIVGCLKLLLSDAKFRETLGCNARSKAFSYDEREIFPKVLEHYSEIIRSFTA